MTRCVLAIAAAVLVAAEAHAGGPPPVYVVVSKVVVEPGDGTAGWVRIEGSFVRLESGTGEYRYGKPVEGFVYLSAPEGKDAETRAEWEKWKSAAGTGKVVAVGSCGDGGAVMRAPIHKAGERVAKPDAEYTLGHLERFGQLYATGGLEREPPVRDLVAFVKARR